MEPGKIVFQGLIRETEVVVRYPTMDDIAPLQEFINTASAERTFIRLQGQVFTFDQEAQYLDDVLSKIKDQEMVKLMVFVGGELVAGGDVIRSSFVAAKHLGELGIIVAKPMRGKGIGRKLVELLIEQARERLPGLEMIILSVYKQNQVAIQLYEQLGFMEYGRLPNGRKRIEGYDDQIEMYLVLHSR